MTPPIGAHVSPYFSMVAGPWYGATVPSTGSTNLTRAAADQWSASDPAVTDFAASFTLMGWFRLASQPSGGTSYSLITKARVASPTTSFSYWWVIYDAGGGVRRFELIVVQDVVAQTQRQITDLIISPTPVTGTWYSWCVVYDNTIAPSANRIVHYIDGATQGAGISLVDFGITSVGNSDANFRVGGTHRATPFPFDGDVSDVLTWDRALNATEVGEIYNKGVQGPLADLATAYGFNGDATDRSGNGVTLSAINSPSFTAATPPVT